MYIDWLPLFAWFGKRKRNIKRVINGDYKEKNRNKREILKRNVML